MTPNPTHLTARLRNRIHPIHCSSVFLLRSSLFYSLQLTMPKTVTKPLPRAEANARYRAMTRANEDRFPNSNLERNNELWHRTVHTDVRLFAWHFLKISIRMYR